MVRQCLGAAAVLAAGVGCKLAEEPAPATDPVVVVHAVLNTASSTRFVLVESTRTGMNEPVTYPGVIPAVPAPAAVSGAEVVLEHLTPPPGCPTPAVGLTERTLDVFGDEISQSGVYVTDALCTLRPGDRVALTVRALGHVITGTTTVPGVGTVSVALRPGENGADTLLVQREQDSIWISTAGMTGAAVQYEVARREHRSLQLPFDVPFTYITDTAGAVSIAGNLVMSFEGEEGTDLLQPGRYYVLTVAAADRNYFDFARSEGDVFTGRGFINHLEGGIGVFGSVDPAIRILKIVAERRTPEEGRYRVSGTLAAGAVDATLEVYRTQGYGGIDPFSAFVEGTWGGTRLTSGVADGAFGEGIRGVGPGSVSFSAEILAGTVPDTVRYYVSGVRGPAGEPFELMVFTFGGAESDAEVLIAVQETSGNESAPIRP